VTELDARLFRTLNAALSDHRTLLLMAALTVIGSGWLVLAMLPLLGFARTRRFGASLLGAIVVQAVVVFALKHVVCRARPCVALAGIHARVFAAPTDYSFPSGHAAGSFAFAAFVAGTLLLSPGARSSPRTQESAQGAGRPGRARRWAAALCLFALAAAVALSRVALGVHFPGDIAAGAIIGGAVGYAAARLHTRRAQP
jgi:undecaprenyl-diphosphatase